MEMEKYDEWKGRKERLTKEKENKGKYSEKV